MRDTKYPLLKHLSTNSPNGTRYIVYVQLEILDYHYLLKLILQIFSKNYVKIHAWNCIVVESKFSELFTSRADSLGRRRV